MENKNNEEILLERMYVGSYLEDSLGHEVINLLQDDKGDNYIYILPSGIINGHNNIKTILLVRKLDSINNIEILAKVIGLERISKEGQKNYIEKNNITYGKVRIDDIFSDNLDKYEVFFTFKAKKIIKPKDLLIL